MNNKRLLVLVASACLAVVTNRAMPSGFDYTYAEIRLPECRWGFDKKAWCPRMRFPSGQLDFVHLSWRLFAPVWMR